MTWLGGDHTAAFRRARTKLRKTTTSFSCTDSGGGERRGRGLVCRGVVWVRCSPVRGDGEGGLLAMRKVSVRMLGPGARWSYLLWFRGRRALIFGKFSEWSWGPLWASV